LELPSSHRLPLSWLLQAASPAIQYRAYAEIVPVEQRDPERLAELRQAALEYPIAKAIARKQRDDGLWGNDLLTAAAPTKPGASDLGTIFQYRRLLEMGWPSDQRPFRIADRFLFRLLSRDEDPLLLAEFQRPAKTDPGLGVWARAMAREGAAAALARAGRAEDPRLRGAAHRIATDVSTFLRSDVAEKLFRKVHGKTVLDPSVTPPSIFAIEMLAFMPEIQRERAGFVDRMAQFLSAPAPRRAFSILAGKKPLKPVFVILGEPMHADAQGRISDVPFATYWLELLARMGIVRQVLPASRTLARLFSECDDDGIWTPAGLRALPKTTNPSVAHYFPLEGAGKSPAQRQTDITFRLALIARLMGMPVEVT